LFQGVGWTLSASYFATVSIEFFGTFTLGNKMKLLLGIFTLLILISYAPRAHATTDIDETVIVDSKNVGCTQCDDGNKKKLLSKAIDAVWSVTKLVRLESGVGIDHFQHSKPQIWWEPQEAHHFRFNKAMATIGLVVPLGDGFHAHVDYEDLSVGSVDMWSRAIANDQNYWACHAPESKVKCRDLSTWIGKGDVTDYLLMIDREFKIPFVTGTKLVLAIGAADRKPTWGVTIPDFTNGIGTPTHYVHVDHAPKRIVAGAADIGLSHGNWELLGTYRETSAAGDLLPAAYHDGAMGLEVVYIPRKKDH
jgi:hypothetical protein